MPSAAGRPRRVVVGAIGAGLALTAYNTWVAATILPREPFRNDLRLYLGAAKVGLGHGWAQIYDLGLQRQAVEALFPHANYQPYINPPPLAWLVAPLTAIDFGIAALLWAGLLLVCLVGSAYVAAPDDRSQRLASVLLTLGLFPAAFAVMIGQVVPVVMAAVIAAYLLLGRDRPWLAGLALALLWLKPQDAVLVPLALLVAGRWRPALSWAAVTLGLALIAGLSLGGAGIEAYGHALGAASGWELMRRYALPGQPDSTLAGLAITLAVAGVALLVARRHRRMGPELPMAAGIAGTLLASRYLGVQDLAMLLPASWLVWRAQSPTWHRGLTAGLYLVLELALLGGPWLVFTAEGAWLISLLLLPTEHRSGEGAVGGGSLPTLGDQPGAGQPGAMANIGQ